MNLIEETRWSIERAKEAARTVFAIPEAEKISESLDRCLEAYRTNGKIFNKNEVVKLSQLNHGDVLWLKDLIANEVECVRFDRQESFAAPFGTDAAMWR